MKAWTVSELDNIVSSLKPLVGARLQEIHTSENDLILGFYTPDGLLWLWVDLNALRPCLLPWSELPLHVPGKKNPLHLFLRAHFVDRILRYVRRHEEHGRVVLLTFGKEGDRLELELRLFPHGRNVLARAEEKQIAWQKPKELLQAPTAQTQEAPARNLDQLREQWLALRGGKEKRKSGAKSPQDLKAKLENELEKKKSALEKVREDLERKRNMPWKHVGDWLKANQSLEVPPEFDPFVDKRRKLSWNIEQCYSKARELEGKMFGTEKRIHLLHDEIQQLEQRLLQPLAKGRVEKPSPQPLQNLDAQGRTLKISNELTAVAGKSATDNLKLLRKARAWDWWFHLRDVPSSHAILFRNKNSKVGDHIVRQVVEWYVRQHLGAKYKKHAGEKIQILIAECRHVRPIKGDRLGRVTYHHERVFTFQVPTS